MLRCFAMLLALGTLAVALVGCSSRDEDPIKVKRSFFDKKDMPKATPK